MTINCKAHSLVHNLYKISLLRQAYKKGSRRNSCSGPDNVGWVEYGKDLNLNLKVLSSALRQGNWKPSVPEIKKINDVAGREFEIAIPNVEDRVVQRAIKILIEPVLEQNAFRDFVFGYRPKKNRIDAIRYANNFLCEGASWVADVDIKNASMGMRNNQVLDMLARYISDGTLLNLIKKCLEVLPHPLFPGSGLSPILLNLRLAEIDNSLSLERLVRFGDNYYIFARSSDDVRDSREQLLSNLHKNGLAMNLEKSKIRFLSNPEDMFLICG